MAGLPQCRTRALRSSAQVPPLRFLSECQGQDLFPSRGIQSSVKLSTGRPKCLPWIDSLNHFALDSLLNPAGLLWPLFSFFLLPREELIW